MLSALIWLFFGDLHRAAQYHEVERMQTYIAKGADVNAVDKKGATPLFYTANTGHVDAAELLLEHGADINFTVPGGGAPLHSALLKHHTDLSLLFIERGADVNKATIAGVTPLHMAAQNGMLSVAHALLDKGADINARTGRGQTPLYLSILAVGLHKDDGGLMRMLLERGADPRLDASQEPDLLGVTLLRDNTATAATRVFAELAETTGDPELKVWLESFVEKVRTETSVDSGAVVDEAQPQESDSGTIPEAPATSTPKVEKDKREDLSESERTALETLERLSAGNRIYFHVNKGHVASLSLYPESAAVLPAISRLSNLESLNLYCEGLREPLPDACSLPPSLKQIQVSDYMYPDLPASLVACPVLESLRIQRGSVERLPEALGGLAHLKTLSIAETPLAALPESMGLLTQLTTLTIEQTALQRLPDSLAQCRALEAIDLTGNALDSVPAVFKTMPIAKINLYKNGLSGSIPEWLFRMPELEYLNLSENTLSGPVPETIATAPKLRWCVLTNNPALSGTLPPCHDSGSMRFPYIHGTGLALASEDLPFFEKERQEEIDFATYGRRFIEDDSDWTGPAVTLPFIGSPVRLKTVPYGFESAGKALDMWDERYCFRLEIDRHQAVTDEDLIDFTPALYKRIPQMRKALEQLEALGKEGLQRYAAEKGYDGTYLNYGTIWDQGELPMRTPEELAPHLYVNSVMMSLFPDGDLRLSVEFSSYEYVFGGHTLSVLIQDGKPVELEW